jgi:hypothetical protein
LLVGLCGSLVLLQWVELQNPFPLQRPLSEVLWHANTLFVGTVALTLVGVAQWVRWRRLVAISRQHPFEPWRWEFPPGLELVDEQLALVSNNVAGVLFLGLVLLFFHGALVLAAFQEDMPVAVPLLFGGILLLTDVVLFRKVVLPTFTGLFALLRYGRTRLRLSQLPLLPGTEQVVELIMPRGRAQLGLVRAVLRRVRERRVTSGTGKNRSSEKVRRTEFTLPVRVNAEPQEGENSFSFVLKVPPVERKDSTDLSGSYRCIWELQINSDVPGLDLDVTFVLPVYWVAEDAQVAAL